MFGVTVEGNMIDSSSSSSSFADEGDIPEIAVELYLIDKLKARVQLARQIDIVQHKVKKENHERQWMKETAEAMELELDSDFMRYEYPNLFLVMKRGEKVWTSDSEQEKPSKQKRKANNAKTAVLKAELKHLLAQPLMIRGVSTRYITSGSNAIADDLIAGECEP